MDQAAFATAKDEACAYVREQILTGKFPSGMRIKPEKVAEALGVSRMPVREALQQLHSEGLATIRPNRGAVVTSLTPEDAIELFEMRAVLEGLAARLAHPRLDSDAVEDLSALVDQMERAAHDPQIWLERHEGFHEALYAYSNRPRLTQQIRNLRASLLPYLRLYIAVYHEIEMQGSEHRMLVSIVQRRDSGLLEAVVRDHVMSAAEGVASFLRKGGNMEDGRSSSTGN